MITLARGRPVSSASLLAAQEGATIYKERCASCHDAPAGRVPPISAIKAMSGEAIYLALTRGAMNETGRGSFQRAASRPDWLHRTYRRPARGRTRLGCDLQRRSPVQRRYQHAAMEWLEQ